MKGSVIFSQYSVSILTTGDPAPLVSAHSSSFLASFLCFLFYILYPGSSSTASSLSRTIFHTTLSHTHHLSTPSFTHNLSHCIFYTHLLSTTIFHTQLCHTPYIYIFHTQLLSHAISYTHFVNHHFFHTPSFSRGRRGTCVAT